MRLRLVVAGAAIVALGGLSLAIARGDPRFSFAGTAAGSAALLIAGWSLAAVGLVFWATLPGNPIGLLLWLTGAAWLLGTWDSPESGSAVIFTFGLVLFAGCAPIVGWVVLGYPTGRLATTVDRVTIGAAFVACAVILGLLPALFYDPAAEFCSQCPDNLALVNANPQRSDSITTAGFQASAAAAVALAGVATWRVARSGAARRRIAGPVVAAGCVYLAAFAWTSIRSAERGFISSGDVDRRLWFVQAGALTALALAAGWSRVRLRRTRTSLTRVVIELAEASSGGLRTLLARSLGDDTLEIAYPVGAGRYAGADGRVIDVPPGDLRLTTPIVRDGRTVAALLHRPGLLDDPELVDEMAASVRLALDNERLQAELRLQEAELRASRARVVDAADSGRRRLERDLHDGAQQRLIGLLIGVRTIRHTGTATDDDHRLDAAANELQEAVDALRDIAHRLHPAALSDEGLMVALEALAERSASPLQVVGVRDERLPAAVEHAAYRIVAETVKAGPVRAVAGYRDDVFVLDLDAVGVPDSLVELQDRVGAIDGRLSLTVTDDGSVRIHVELPCEAAACG